MLELASEPRRSFSKQTGERKDETELNREMKVCTVNTQMRVLPLNHVSE